MPTAETGESCGILGPCAAKFPRSDTCKNRDLQMLALSKLMTI